MVEITGWRLVPQFDSDLLRRSQDPRRYRVECVDLLTASEAMALLRELGSPYNGQLFDNRPTGD